MKLADVVTVVELGRIAWTRPARDVTEEELAAVDLSAGPELRTAATRPRSLLPTPTKNGCERKRSRRHFVGPDRCTSITKPLEECRVVHIHPTCKQVSNLLGGK